MAGAAESPSDRFALVSSLYGPGGIGCWLCTLASVFVTWTLNSATRQRDIITNDLIAALAIPAVAAGHLLYLLASLPRETDGVTQAAVARSQLFTSTEPAMTQHAAAAEAALTVCETFAAAAVALVFIAALRGHLMRMKCVLLVGLLTFSTEAVILVQTRGVDVAASNLARPFLFNFVEVMASILAFLAVWVSVFIVVIVWLRIKRWSRKGNDPALPAGDLAGDSVPGAATHSTMDLMANRDSDGQAAQHARQLRAIEFIATQAKQEPAAMRWITLVSVFFLPASFLSTFFGATGMLGETHYMTVQMQNWALRLPLFFPKSAISITDLDQAVALSLGIVTLLFSLWDAFKAQRGKVERGAELDRRAPTTGGGSDT